MKTKRISTGIFPVMRIVFFTLIAIVMVSNPLAAQSPLKVGKQVFEKQCGRCHSLAKGLTVVQTKSQWKKTVKKMVAYGASLDRKERKNVVKYLSARSLFDRSCSLCHELGQVVTDDSQTQDWAKTLDRMDKHFGEVKFEDRVEGKRPPSKKEKKEIVELLKVLLAQ